VTELASRRATIHDVARRAAVSRSTASRALTNTGYVSPDARASVLAAAEDLGYRPNQLARSMILGKTFTLGVIVSDIENPFFARATRAITDSARAAGFGVILANTDEDVAAERAAVALFLDKRIDGMVVAPAAAASAEHLQAARSAGCHIVLLDRSLDGLDAGAVLVDNHAAARDAVDRLVAAGHHRVALVTKAGYQTNIISSVAERIQGYQAALRAAGAQPDPRYEIHGAVDLQATKRLLHQLLTLDRPPTALLTTDSRVGLWVLKALQEAKLSLPDDISMVTFDDAEWTSVVTPRVTVVDQPVYQLGATAATMLIEQIEHGRAATTPVRLPTTFLGRGSVGPPAHR
jgi:LacI family transcriptional regulator